MVRGHFSHWTLLSDVAHETNCLGLLICRSRVLDIPWAVIGLDHEAMCGQHRRSHLFRQHPTYCNCGHSSSPHRSSSLLVFVLFVCWQQRTLVLQHTSPHTFLLVNFIEATMTLGWIIQSQVNIDFTISDPCLYPLLYLPLPLNSVSLLRTLAGLILVFLKNIGSFWIRMWYSFKPVLGIPTHQVNAKTITKLLLSSQVRRQEVDFNVYIVWAEFNFVLP